MGQVKKKATPQTPLRNHFRTEREERKGRQTRGRAKILNEFREKAMGSGGPGDSTKKQQNGGDAGQ